MTRIRPDRVIVTSNYPPECIFKESETLKAIKRRYEVINMTAPLIPYMFSRDGHLPNVFAVAKPDERREANERSPAPQSGCDDD